MVRRNNIKNKAFAIILITTFLAQDVVWAYPDVSARRMSDKLATQSFLRDNESPAKTEAMFIHRSIAKRIQKPLQEISLDDIRNAANKLVEEYSEWAAQNNITVTSSKEEVLVAFSSGYVIRYFISTIDRPDIDRHSEMAVIATVPFKRAKSIYKQLLKIKPGQSIEKFRKKAKILSPVREAEKLNLEINRRVLSLFKALKKGRMRSSYVIAPALENARRNFEQSGYANTQLMRTLSERVFKISRKWSASARLSERSAKLVAVMERRDAALEKIGIDDCRSVRDLTGDERKNRILLLIAGIEMGLNKAIAMRSSERYGSTQVKRFEEILGYVQESVRWVNGKSMRPAKDLEYCARALGAISANTRGELNKLLIDLSDKLAILHFAMEAPAQDTAGPATLRGMPLFKKLYTFTDRVFGKTATNIIMAPAAEWIFLLPGIISPAHRSAVIGIVMLIFTVLHLYNIDWKDFARAPPKDKAATILKTVFSPAFISLIAVCCSYYGDTPGQIILTNIISHAATNAFVETFSKKQALPENKPVPQDTRTAEERERDAKEKRLDYYIDNAGDILNRVTEKSGAEEESRVALEALFNEIADIYINTADPVLVEKRKKLLAILILMNIKPPANAKKDDVPNTRTINQSELRSEICKKILTEKIFGSNNHDIFQPALEAVIELLAKDKKRGKAFFFDRYYPILKDSGKLPRFANALINVLIDSEHHNIILFNIDDRNVFFDETKLIIKDLSLSMPSLRRNITSYLFQVLRSEGEILLVRRLLEDINFHIVNSEEFGRFSAFKVAAKIRQLQRERSDKSVVLVLSGGTTMPAFLDELAKAQDVDWHRVEIFHHTEYIGKSPENSYSFANMINEHLIRKIYSDADRGHFHPIGAMPNMKGYIEELNRFGGADILVLGLGSNGHIGYNGVGTVLDEKESGSLKLVRLESSTIRENKRSNPDIEKNPYAYTMSMADIMKARKIYLIASGPRKTHIVRLAFEKPLLPKVPVSVVLEHPNISVILDNKAVEGLTEDQFTRYSEAAEKLDRAEERMRLLINNKLKPSHKIDREGTIVWITPEEAQMLGYKPEDMRGRPVWDFVADPERDKSKKAVMAKMANPQELPSFERRYRRSNGEELWFHIEERQVLDEQGKVAGIISHMADITKEKMQRERLASELQQIEVHMNGNGRKHASPDIASDNNGRPIERAATSDMANPSIIVNINNGKAIEIDEKSGRVFRISHDRLNNRAPPIEEHFRSNGTFGKIRAAKDTALLRRILEKSNFRNLTPLQKEELIKIVLDIKLSVILGKSYVAKTTNEGEPYYIRLHARTGFNFDYHRLKPTIWVGEVTLDRFSMEQVAQLLLEESQHILKKARQLPDGTWINGHGNISETDHPEWVIEHDKAFVASINRNEPSLTELLNTAEPPAEIVTLGSIHEMAVSAEPMPNNAQILLSENLFNEFDIENLRRLLGENSPVKIMSPKDMRDLYRARKNLACVITKDDYDNPNLWNRASAPSNKASLLVLSQDLQDSRYLFLEGVVALAQAMVREDRESIAKYMKMMFNTTRDVSNEELLEILLRDPRRFSDYIRFNTEPFEKEKLYEHYKSDIENFLIKA